MKKTLDSIDKKLHDQFSNYGLRAKEWMRKCVILLPEIEKREIWKKKGFSSIYEYAAKIAGMSRNTVNEALRIFEKIADKPELQRVVEVRGINAIKPVVTIATKETSAFWAQKAEEMSKNTLETYVREIRSGRLSTEEKDVAILKDGKFYSQIKSGSDYLNAQEKATNYGRLGDQGKLLPRKAAITMEVDPEIAEKLKKLKGQGSWDALMKEFLELREEKLESEKPESVETTSRYIPAKIKKHAIQKTNGTCAFPGCTQSYKILHHTKRFALTNEHDVDTLQPLCEEHENLAHLGLIENEDKDSGYWSVRRLPDFDDPKYEVDIAVQRLRQRIRIE